MSGGNQDQPFRRRNGGFVEAGQGVDSSLKDTVGRFETGRIGC